jgi:triosephosphate isomerase
MRTLPPIKKIVVFNWKMNPEDVRAGRRLMAWFRVRRNQWNGVTVVLCPPYPYLALAQGMAPVQLGAQNCFWESEGAFTGELSPGLLRGFGAGWVIVGHSERRAMFCEIDASVREKLKAATRAGLCPVLCVGENGATHRKGMAATRAFIVKQLKTCITGIPPKQLAAVVVTYEPVWAISGASGNKADDPRHAAVVGAVIRNFLARRGIRHSLILYGGSVNRTNIQALEGQNAFDGYLIGAASLRTRDISVILDTVSHTR